MCFHNFLPHVWCKSETSLPSFSHPRYASLPSRNHLGRYFLTKKLPFQIVWNIFQNLVIFLYVLGCLPVHCPAWTWKASQRDSCQRSSFFPALFLENSIDLRLLPKKCVKTWVKHPNKVALFCFLSCPSNQFFYCNTSLEEKRIRLNEGQMQGTWW